MEVEEQIENIVCDNDDYVLVAVDNDMSLPKNDCNVVRSTVRPPGNMNDDIRNTGNASSINDEIIGDPEYSLKIDLHLLNDLRDDGEKRMTDLCRVNSLGDFMAHGDFLKSITTPTDKSPGEIFLMILDHAIRYKSSLNELCSMLQLVNSIFSRQILPESRHIVDKIINQKDIVEYYGYCSNCYKYVGKITEFKSVTCEKCLETGNLANPSSLNIFVTINPSTSIQLLLQEYEEYYDYTVTSRGFKQKICDVFDGKLYRNLVKNLPDEYRHNYATVIFNTDGAPRFESYQYSIWPIYLQLNEIPIEKRFQNIITCGMWFGKNKPQMSTFLIPLTKIMNKLSTVGVECNIKKQKRVVKILSIISCVDSQARAPMQGIKQFNDKFGCSWCLHPGKWFEGNMRYPVLEAHPEHRLEANMIDCMERVVDGDENVFGVNDVSTLIHLNYFDIVNGFLPDYIDCCLVGVGKQVTGYFLNLLPSSTIERLNEMLLNIKVPHQLGTLSRSFVDLNNWKAREWENFILYYSIPLFESILKKRLMEYWKLFVQSLYILLKTEITLDELNKADEDLHKFVFLTEEHFSEKAMTYDVHQLLHIAESVLNWGPLWCHSTFPFKSANHNMLNAIHNAKGVNKIIRFINLQHSALVLSNKIFPHAMPTVLEYCKEISKKRIHTSLKLPSIKYLGDGVSIRDDAILQNLGLTKNYTASYIRVIINGSLYMSSKKKTLRSDNSFAKLFDDTFVQILEFLVDSRNKREIAICRIINTSDQVCNHMFKIRCIGHENVAIKTSKIATNCIIIKGHEDNYIAALPNLVHY